MPSPSNSPPSRHSPNNETHPLPIPPRVEAPTPSMLPFTFTSHATSVFPIIPSDKEFIPRDKDTSSSNSSADPFTDADPVITDLMSDVAIMANTIPQGNINLGTLNAVHRIISTRDQMITTLALPEQQFSPEGILDIDNSIATFNEMAFAIGLPPIPEDLIDAFHEQARCLPSPAAIPLVTPTPITIAVPPTVPSPPPRTIPDELASPILTLPANLFPIEF
jgi:hypothetical protein